MGSWEKYDITYMVINSMRAASVLNQNKSADFIFKENQFFI